MQFTFGVYSGKITETKMFSFIANLKFFFIPLQEYLENQGNHPNGSPYNMVHLTVGFGELCLQNCLSVRWMGLCLLLDLSVFWLGPKFGIGFVCLLVAM